MLDVNVGLPGTDEAAAMRRTVASLQTVTGLPLQLDSASPAALEAGMRIYNGKPMVNSVDGSEAKMAAVFPLVKKYGGLTVALTMDDKGIPGTAAGRVEIAERIVRRAAEYGIGTRDLVFDPLTLSVSAEAGAARVTLDTVALLHARGFHTVLGISNVSFGLPERDTVNAAFFSAALEAGLSAAIMNPFSSLMTGALRARMLFESLDPGCKGFVEWAAKKAGEAAKTAPVQAPVQTGISGVAEPSAGLRGAICSGLREKSAELAAEIPGDRAPVDVINEEIIPALNLVGQAFEEKRLFLPQLLMSAEAASAAFAVLRERMPAAEADAARPVILATVKGDIHDIGKNIVKLMLESYGFKVHDLGKNVPPEAVLGAVRATGCRLVGLSALMTTTVPAMEETVRLLHEREPDVKVMVGGAVITRDYAAKIGADAYSKDAMGAVEYAESFYRAY